MSQGLALESGEFIPAEELNKMMNAKSKCAQCGKGYSPATGAVGCPKCAPGVKVDEVEFRQPLGEQQPAPSAAGVGNSGFDYQTAADVLNGKTVSDEVIRKFVAASRWAHDDRVGLRATLLSVRGELASREAEIALLKKALMDAEASQPSPSAETAGNFYPHAELRKTWQPGQRWQARSFRNGQWGPWTDAVASEPFWFPHQDYRRHPDDLAPQPSPTPQADSAPASVAGTMQFGGCPECGSRSCVARGCSRTVSHAAQAIPGVQWQCGPQASGFTAPQADSQPAPVRGKLLPCPCCGGEAAEHDRFNSNTVRCLSCGLRVKQSEMGMGDAAKRWNSRAARAPADSQPAGVTLNDAIEIAKSLGVREYGPNTRNWSFEYSQLVRFVAALTAPQADSQPAPIDVVLHCPKCGLQHIDAAEPELGPSVDGSGDMPLWANPPHRSHLCHGCGHIWRPADVPTNGVQAVKTTGKADSPIAARAPADSVLEDAALEVLMEHSGCGSGTQVEMLTVKLNPGDKVVMLKGRITQAIDAAIDAERAALAQKEGK